jgi:hypothetical protein
MWIGGSSKIARTAEAVVCPDHLFGSGFAGLGSAKAGEHAGDRWMAAI